MTPETESGVDHALDALEDTLAALNPAPAVTITHHQRGVTVSITDPPPPPTPRPPCDTFHWIGQTFRSCENCGRPYWDHGYRFAMGGDPFSLGPRQTIPITPDEAEACRRKWAR